MSAARTVTLYARPGCHLCDDARAQLERLRADEPFALREVDITTEDALHARYLERIPVVALDGRELFDFFVDADALLGALRAQDGRPGGGSIVAGDELRRRRDPHR